MGNEVEKLLEQMPKVDNPIEKPPDTSTKDGSISFHAAKEWAYDEFERGAQAQREADVKWIVEQELVRLPSEEEMVEKIRHLQNCHTFYGTRAIGEELHRLLTEGYKI